MPNECWLAKSLTTSTQKCLRIPDKTLHHTLEALRRGTFEVQVKQSHVHAPEEDAGEQGLFVLLGQRDWITDPLAYRQHKEDQWRASTSDVNAT